MHKFTIFVKRKWHSKYAPQTSITAFCDKSRTLKKEKKGKFLNTIIDCWYIFGSLYWLHTLLIQSQYISAQWQSISI